MCASEMITNPERIRELAATIQREAIRLPNEQWDERLELESASIALYQYADWMEWVPKFQKLKEILEGMPHD